MRKGDGLRGLQMREARHDGFGMRAGLQEQLLLQGAQPRFGAFAGLAHPEPEIRRHLIVARACGVQPRTGRAHKLRQPRFDIEMDVFELALEGETAFGDLGRDLIEAFQDGVCVDLRDDALLRQHLRVRLRARDVLFGQPFVEFDGGVNLLHDGSGAAFETPAPHLVRTHELRVRCLAKLLEFSPPPSAPCLPFYM